MNFYIQILIGILIPFIGTTIGAAIVLFMKKSINQVMEKIFLGFASGVMIAASVWSLIIPSIEMATSQGKIGWLPATFGIITGTLFLKFTDIFLEKRKINTQINNKTKMLVFAVTLHNIPEGMAVGVAFATLFNPSLSIGMAAAFALSIGIAIQNFPEGATISLPLRSEKLSRNKSFLIGVLSRNSRTYCSFFNNITFKFYWKFITFFTSLCSRCNDICCCGRLNTRIPKRQVFKYWYMWCYNRVFDYDDIR